MGAQGAAGGTTKAAEARQGCGEEDKVKTLN